MSIYNEPDFPTWTREVLNGFAKDAFRQMLRDREEIDQLKQDNKLRREAFNNLLLESSKWQPQKTL